MIIAENLQDIINYLVPSVFLYAELHYKFTITGSKYFINEPEIITDTPIRIEPKKPIPIFLIIKDSNIYPVMLKKIAITLYKDNNLVITKNVNYGLKINTPWWEDIIYFDNININGNIEIDIEISYTCNNTEKKCYIHNYPNSNHDKLTTHISKYAYPRTDKTFYGDLHCHTNLTEDMVEFGASLKSTLIAAEMTGLDFYCNTDHSYDLDDKVGSWNENDPKLKKWNSSRDEIKQLNKSSNYNSFIIPSEELSLHNLKKRNIHALIFNNSRFIPGSGDSGEKPFNFYSDYNTGNINTVLEQDALCIAAHPFVKVPFLQWLFVKRGRWEIKDILNDSISGIQILNGAKDKGFYDGYKIWIDLLLKGYKKYIYAGNDAHGNFNLFRQIKIPMINLHEKKEQVFGEYRTGVLLDSSESKNINAIITALKNGNCFLTNGPYLDINILHKNDVFKIGSTLNANQCYIKIHVISSPEFGKIKEIKIIRGVINSKNEDTFFSIENLNKYKLSKHIQVYNYTSSYYRCEVKLSNENIFAMTNPIWIN